MSLRPARPEDIHVVDDATLAALNEAARPRAEQLRALIDAEKASLNRARRRAQSTRHEYEAHADTDTRCRHCGKRPEFTLHMQQKEFGDVQDA